MDHLQLVQQVNRRVFLHWAGLSLGSLALGSLLNADRLRASSLTADAAGGLPGLPHFAPKAKRVIYLFQSGAPSQMDLFDYKPLLNKLNGEQLPEHVRGGQRLTG